MRFRVGIAMYRLLPLLLTLSCQPTQTPDPDVEDPVVPTGEGLFARGCPQPGQARALVMAGEERLAGTRAVGRAGDVALFNEHAAFVISRAGSDATYWYYGGALVDAAPVAGCAQVQDDKLEEKGLVLGELNLAQFEQSLLRAFEATEVTVLADGSDGGAAIVRASGRDATHWLVEYTLQRDAGGERTFGRSFDVEITVDYVLEPGSRVLRQEITVTNASDAPRRLFTAVLFTLGDTLDVHRFSRNGLGLAGLDVSAGVPWMVATDGEGAYAYATDGVNLGALNVSGVDVLLDLDQVLTKPLEPSPGASATQTTYFAVGDRDGASATGALHAVHPMPLRDDPYEPRPVDVTVVDASGSPVPGMEVRLEASDDGEWGILDVFYSDADGGLQGTLPAFESGLPLRWRPVADGRDDAAPVEVDLTAGAALSLSVLPSGELEHAITDPDGGILPARLELTRVSDGARRRRFVFGEGSVPLPPGTWDWVATRGFEWAPQRGTVTVPEDGVGRLEATLVREVDTTGWLTADTHIHSQASADSPVLQERQLLVGASHGLGVAVATDHEIVVDFTEALQRAGLQGHMGSVPGEEVTATVPEHMTMFPTPPDGTPLGGFIRWYGMDLPELVDAMRARGADVAMMNHPGWLREIGWDRVAGRPTVTDPTVFGLDPDAELWTWDLDGVDRGHDQRGHPLRRRRQRALRRLDVVPQPRSRDHGGRRE
jgi:hypothetical protein